MSHVEQHPFEPFLPENAKVLFLGSFPPQEKRWSMPFYYPNWLNDFWRVAGLLFYGDKDHFTVPGEKRFDMQRIIAFCRREGIAMYDTASAVRRLRDNASDKFLEVVTPTDIRALLEKIPQCRTLVVTGEKAAETLSGQLQCEIPAVGHSAVAPDGLTVWRMPSTSRAYPLALEKKAQQYRKVFDL